MQDYEGALLHLPGPPAEDDPPGGGQEAPHPQGGGAGQGRPQSYEEAGGGAVGPRQT